MKRIKIVVESTFNIPDDWDEKRLGALGIEALGIEADEALDQRMEKFGLESWESDFTVDVLTVKSD